VDIVGLGALRLCLCVCMYVIIVISTDLGQY